MEIETIGTDRLTGMDWCLTPFRFRPCLWGFPCA